MDNCPLYLYVFFFKIRKHGLEEGYLLSRLKGAEYRRAVDETSMLAKLEDLGFLTRSKDHHDIRFRREKAVYVEGEVAPDGNKETLTVSVPDRFLVLSRGRWYLTEVIARCVMWLLTAFLGAFIALLIAA